MTAAEAAAPPNLFDKVWDAHAVRELPGGQTQLLIGLHLLHEVTSPQAFAMLRERDLGVAYPGRTLATVDHIIPTDSQLRPLQDALAEEMMEAIERNCRDFGVKLLTPETGDQGIVHVVGPERGLTQPGMTVVCGDSHTSTHGAFGTIALGIGTSQVAHVLATGTLALAKPKVRRVSVDGALPPGVTAKDVALAIIRALGVQGGVGYAYEYAGSAFESDLDGGADDRLQHVHRGRRPLRLRLPGRYDGRVPPRPRSRPDRRRLRPGRRVVAERWPAARTPGSTMRFVCWSRKSSPP